MSDFDFNSIKAIGFDLDRTLYVETPEIRDAERASIYRAVSTRLSVPYDEARRLFEAGYADTHSGGKTLVNLGIADGREVLRQALKRADISRFLMPDQRLVSFMERLSHDYVTFLITESLQESGLKKLNALALSPSLFHHVFFWDSSPLRKDDGSVYSEITRLTGFLPEEYLYCGNSVSDDILPPVKLGYKTALVGGNCPEATVCIPTVHDLEVLLYGTR